MWPPGGAVLADLVGKGASSSGGGGEQGKQGGNVHSRCLQSHYVIMCQYVSICVIMSHNVGTLCHYVSLCGDFLYIAVLVIGAVRRSRD